MGIMFRNSNVGLEKELGADDYKAHPIRNRMAVFAVVLTTILIVVTFTVGIGFVNTVSLYIGAAPGPGADGNHIIGDEEVLERVRKLPQVDWAAFVQRCSTTYLHNKEFSGLEVRLFAADDVHYEKNMVDLIAGKYPEGADEILVSDTLSNRLGLGEEIGIDFPLTVVLQAEEGETENVIPMKVCGYYNNPLRSSSNVYEEIYTGKDFIETYNPLLAKGHDIIYVKLNNLSIFRLGHDKYEKLNEVNTLAEGNGTSYKMSNLGWAVVIPVLLVVVCVMCCGYFFIYNIFDISVVNDIRFYGELKTIGMTSGQLRRMLFWQMNRIAFTGIVTGGVIGYGIGLVSSEMIINTYAEGIAVFYQPAGFVQTFLVSSFFAWLTVYISTMKPFRTACFISPVEAARYGGKRKKGIFSVLSFALSGILFLVIYTVTIGYRVEVMVERYNETDFRIYHRASLWMQDEAYRPISQELIRKLESLDFAEDFRVCYQARTKPDYSAEWLERTGTYTYNLSQGEITKDGELARDMAAYNTKLEREGNDPYYDGFSENERGNYVVGVMGIEPEYLTGEEKYITVLEGTLDAEQFAKGEYMIYQRSIKNGYQNEKEGMEYQVHAGDEVTVTFYDDAADCYVEKQLKVMAVIGSNDMYGTGNTSMSNIIIDNAAFQSIYSDYENLVTRICFNVSEAESKEDDTMALRESRYHRICEILEEDGNLQLTLNAKYISEVEFTETKRSIGAFGMFLVVIVGLIGISNIVNTVTTDVMARKLEYAAMQSIGMTKRQMEREVFSRYARYIFTAVGLAAATSVPLTYMVAESSMFTEFSVFAFVQALLLFSIFSICLCALMARLLTGVMNKKSIVERLREIV